MKLSMKVTYPLLLSGLVLASFGAQATGKYNGQDRGKPVSLFCSNTPCWSRKGACTWRFWSFPTKPPPNPSPGLPVNHNKPFRLFFIGIQSGLPVS